MMLSCSGVVALEAVGQGGKSVQGGLSQRGHVFQKHSTVAFISLVTHTCPLCLTSAALRRCTVGGPRPMPVMQQRMVQGLCL
jgi:hypothetical protein